jgi:hypothetical protein
MFTPQLFIKLYAEARKLSPPRFLTLRLHPDRYKELYSFADIPEAIQLGNTIGPLGRPVMRVCCVRTPSSLADGIAIKEDESCERDKLYFEIHGQPELVVEELYCEPITEGPTNTRIN